MREAGVSRARAVETARVGVRAERAGTHWRAARVQFAIHFGDRFDMEAS